MCVILGVAMCGYGGCGFMELIVQTGSYSHCQRAVLCDHWENVVSVGMW